MSIKSGYLSEHSLSRLNSNSKLQTQTNYIPEKKYISDTNSEYLIPSTGLFGTKSVQEFDTEDCQSCISSASRRSNGSRVSINSKRLPKNTQKHNYPMVVYEGDTCSEKSFSQKSNKTNYPMVVYEGDTCSEKSFSQKSNKTNYPLATIPENYNKQKMILKEKNNSKLTYKQTDKINISLQIQGTKTVNLQITIRDN
jgi:hypothetical protein